MNLGDIMVKVSVIVPVFNSEKYLSSCLNSLVNQSLEEIEIIAIDDCSTDNSLDILKAYEIRYPGKIKVLSNDKNYGQGYSRNIGILYASGEYIGFVDSDDYVHYHMFEDMYNGAYQNDLPEVVTTGILFAKDNSYSDKDLSYMSRRNGIVIDTLQNPSEIISQSPSCCNKIFRRDTLKDMEFLESRMWEDVAFTYTELFNSNRIFSFNNSDYFYRKRMDSGVSAKGFVVNSDLLDCFAVADELEKRTRKSGRFEVFSNEIKFIQIAFCLQRAAEVLKWNIPSDVKDKLCFYICKLVNEKYGDFKNIDLGLLSSKIGIQTIDVLKSLDTYDGEVESYEDSIRQELKLLFSVQINNNQRSK